MFKLRAGIGVLVVALASVGSPALAAGAGDQVALTAADLNPISQPTGAQPVMACKDLASETLLDPLGGTDFSRIPDAPTRILSATVVPASADTPEYCQLQGYVWPQISFEIRLPTKTWNGRYFQTGCGGFCGNVPISSCGDALSLNFAVAAEDSGHTGGDGLWGLNSEQARIDFGYRSPHVVSIAAKEIIRTYYGQPAAHSYYRGCSMGGRQAFMIAQRFPDDFDGILAGHPALQILQGSIANNWLAQKGRRDDQSIILQGPKLAALHDAVLAACDGLDGLVDGLIDDPRNCQFDPAMVGLTLEELAAAEAFYAGPHTADGIKVYPGFVPYGSELDWASAVTISTYYANQALRFLVFQGLQTPPLSYTYRDFNFNTDVPKLRDLLDTYDVINPDLTAFHMHGGKFISYHGMADSTVSYLVSVSMLNHVATANGGLDQISSWYRLFLVPGMFHCGGGPQPVRLDPTGTVPAGVEPLTQLVNWVESDAAPDKLIASYLDQSGQVFRTRPIYPYPMVARYSGSGSIDDAANFVPTNPPVLHNDDIRWIFSPGPGMTINSR